MAWQIQAVFWGSGIRRALSVLLAALGVFLLFAEKPWVVDVPGLLADGEKVPLDAFIADGLWWASLVNFVLLAVLLLTAGWWTRVPAVSAAPPPRRSGISLPDTVFVVALAAVAVFAAVERMPRLGLSLWNDEEYTLRRYAHGYEDLREDGTVRFKPVEWREVFFYNAGNNHVPFSLAARLSLGVWSALGGGSEGRRFAEWAYRLPAFLAGLASIVLIGMLLRREGAPVAGLATAALLALHPWHLRYSVEARGYAFLLVALILALLCVALALRRGHWRDWLGFGLAQFFAVWCFSGAVYFAIGLNLLVACVLIGQRPFRARGLPLAVRWLVANMASAMLYLQLNGPALRQIRMYLERDIARGVMGPDWFLDIGAHLFAGVRYAMDDPAFPQYLSLGHIPGFQDGGGLWIALALAGLILVGLVWAARLGVGAFLTVAAPVLGGCLAVLHTAATGNFLFSWYLLFMLCGLVPAVFLGIEGVAMLVAGGRARAGIAAGLCLLVVTAYGAATAETRRHVREVPRQPLRESIRFAQSVAGDPLIATYGVSSRQFKSYHAGLIPIDGDNAAEDLALLDSLIAQSRRTDRPLLVLFSGGPLERGHSPELAARVGDARTFRHLGTFRGLEEFFEVDVYRLRSADPQ